MDALMRINQAIQCCNQGIDLEPDRQMVQEWLEEFHPVMRVWLKVKGFEKVKESIDFKRFMLERKYSKINEYLQQHLSEEDYRLWIGNTVNQAESTSTNDLK